MTDSLARTEAKKRFLEAHFVNAVKWSGMLSGFCASTGLTNEHIAATSFTPSEDRLKALLWACENEATPAEMIGWMRLQNE